MPGKTPATLLTPFVFFSAELEQPAYPAFGAIWAAGSTYNAPVSKKAKKWSNDLKEENRRGRNLTEE